MTLLGISMFCTVLQICQKCWRALVTQQVEADVAKVCFGKMKSTRYQVSADQSVANVENEKPQKLLFLPSAVSQSQLSVILQNGCSKLAIPLGKLPWLMIVMGLGYTQQWGRSILCRYDWVVWLVLVMGLGYIHWIYSRVSCRYDNNYNYNYNSHIYFMFA